VLLLASPLSSSQFKIVPANRLSSCEVDALGDYQKFSGHS
jgi:hypothetical protein